MLVFLEVWAKLLTVYHQTIEDRHIMTLDEWQKSLGELQEKAGYYFKDEELLKVALTHSSYVNESELSINHNERLEFLGDSVVGLFFSKELFRRFSTCREGELTHMRARLVSGYALGERAKEIGLERYLLLGKGEECQGGRQRQTLLANAFEAFVGAIFLDGGFRAVQRFLGNISEHVWDTLECNEKSKDNKSLLQELMQQKYKSRPDYSLLGTHGPEHRKSFEVSVTLPNGKVLVARGSTLKQAEQIAAGLALEACCSED